MTNQLLKSVKLSGYKTIKDLDIELEEGLNILIGKNSVGKSNFLDFLHKVLSLKIDDITNFSSEIKLFNDSVFRIEKIFTLEKGKDEKSFVTSEKQEFYYDNVKFESNTDFIKYINDEDKGYQLIKICHGLPKNKAFIADDVYFKIGQRLLPDNIFKIINNDDVTEFTKYILLTLVKKFLLFNFSENIDASVIKKDLLNHFEEILFDLNFNIENISSIQKVRINNGFDLQIEDDSISIKNLKLEYLVDDEWLDYEHLSDGTKRIFYIVSEVLNFGETHPLVNTPFGLQSLGIIDYRSIILIEEPEIGLHPKQFNSLLQFLKDEAETKQIIFTTHSPLSLNVLNFNELDKITVFNKKDNLTTASKISEKERKKIYDFKEESGLFLSDYWLFANTDF